MSENDIVKTGIRLDDSARWDDDLTTKEQYACGSLHLDKSTTLKWKIDNFALLTMRHYELRSPEFDGPKNTRWMCVLVLGDPRQKKAEERFVEIQLYLVHCPEETTGYEVKAGYKLFGNEMSFSSSGAVDTDGTASVTKSADPNKIQHSWQYGSSLTNLFTDLCAVSGALRVGVTVELVVADDRFRMDRRVRFPLNFPHYLPNMLFLNDLFFVSASGDRTPAHKGYMREVSPVLKEAIGCMGNAQDFSLKQFHSESVTAFVVFCYTGVLYETYIRGFATEVLKLAHVFNIPSLMLEVADYALRNTEAEGPVRCYKIASEYGAHTQLRKAALQIIARKFSELQTGPGGLLELLTMDQRSELCSALLDIRSCNEAI